jgi:LDH2 family malate/lactate/ureidoglycolate dehydrogenase
MVVADILVEADLLGHGTHGIQLLPRYLDELETGGMRATGEPVVLADTGAAFSWDGQQLPGPWLVCRALDAALEAVNTAPVITATIARSHHIACLQTYLRRATERGYLCLIASADPVSTGIVPHGGTRPSLSSNPLAIGIPTSGDPILVDFATATTSFGRVRSAVKSGDRLPGEWVVDHLGNASDDPAVVFADPPGAILPLGGVDLGYKGFGLMLAIDALTNALAGSGRAKHHSGWLASVFLQVIDPARFGGRATFVDEMDYLAESCRNSPPRDGVERVRLPGDAALERRKRLLVDGIPVGPTLRVELAAWAAKLKVEQPSWAFEQ